VEDVEEEEGREMMRKNQQPLHILIVHIVKRAFYVRLWPQYRANSVLPGLVLLK
jgi:hypothetical protein